MKLNCQITLTSRILKREEKRSNHVVRNRVHGAGGRRLIYRQIGCHTTVLSRNVTCSGFRLFDKLFELCSPESLMRISMILS